MPSIPHLCLASHKRTQSRLWIGLLWSSVPAASSGGLQTDGSRAERFRPRDPGFGFN